MSTVEANQVKIKLPSISELTSKAPPAFEGFRDLSSVPSGATASISTTPSNYILSGPSPRIPSPTNSFYEQKYQQHVLVQAFHQPIQYYQLPQPQYYQPIYIEPQQLPSPPTVPATQYMIPEVINKPVNKCHRCGTTETPEWRRGPNGVRTLCNACGLFHAKLVKRKGAALAAEEVLNNKVCKGKNGRRIAIKKKIIENNVIPKDIKSVYN